MADRIIVVDDEREKMHEPARKPKFIKTVWGVGYEIEN